MVTERKSVRPRPGATFAACGKPSEDAVAQARALASAPASDSKNKSTCAFLSQQFGMTPDTAGCAGGSNSKLAAEMREIWQSSGCQARPVALKKPLIYAGCDPRRHIDNVDTYILNSPKPCFDDKGELEGHLDWCQGESKDPGCSAPPCQPTGSLCPKTHPYPFTKDGVEDGGCCSSPELVHSKDGKHRLQGVGELPELQDPVAIGPDGAPIPEDEPEPGALRKWDPKTGEYEARGHKRNPARKPPLPLHGSQPARAPPSLGSPIPTASQHAPLFEAFGAMGQGHCQGSSVDCPDPPCRSGENVVERERAWTKVEKLNAELLSLVKKAEGQKERAFKKGTKNVSETHANTQKLRAVQAELKKEHQKVLEARAALDRTNTDTGAGGQLAVNMEWWRVVGYGMMVAVVLGVAIHVAIAGTMGTAEVIAGIAGALLLVFYAWQWVAENWSRIRAQGKGDLGFL